MLAKKCERWRGGEIPDLHTNPPQKKEEEKVHVLTTTYIQIQYTTWNWNEKETEKQEIDLHNCPVFS